MTTKLIQVRAIYFEASGACSGDASCSVVDVPLTRSVCERSMLHRRELRGFKLITPAWVDFLDRHAIELALYSAQLDAYTRLRGLQASSSSLSHFAIT